MVAEHFHASVDTRAMDDRHVSFDLAVLAMGSSAGATTALAMFERCNRAASHVEGPIDSRVTAICDALAARFPLDDPSSAWAMIPAAGGDHVIMHLNWSPFSGPVIEAIQELAPGMSGSSLMRNPMMAAFLGREARPQRDPERGGCPPRSSSALRSSQSLRTARHMMWHMPSIILGAPRYSIKNL